MVMPKMGVRNIIFNWPADSREAAENIISKYGEPDEAVPSRLIWNHNGPWKRTIVYRDSVKHDFPQPHTDCVEQFVGYEVPMEKACELSAFNGSISFSRTRGEISSCCRDEPANILGLNLAIDIIREKKTFELARYAYTQNMIAYQQHKPALLMEKLLFKQEMKAADPDESTSPEKELSGTVEG